MDKSLIYLTQTDTTVGFLSSDDKKLANTKRRDSNQKTLQVVNSFKTLKNFTRIPKTHRKFIRKSVKTTFIYPNKMAFRVTDKGSSHFPFINKCKVMYSTSANITKQNFDNDFAFNNSDIIVFTGENFEEKSSSHIYKLYKNKKEKIR